MLVSSMELESQGTLYKIGHLGEKTAFYIPFFGSSEKLCNKK